MIFCLFVGTQFTSTCVDACCAIVEGNTGCGKRGGRANRTATDTIFVVNDGAIDICASGDPCGTWGALTFVFGKVAIQIGICTFSGSADAIAGVELSAIGDQTGIQPSWITSARFTAVVGGTVAVET